MISYIDTYKDQVGVEAICRVFKQADRRIITSRGYQKATTRVLSARTLSTALLIPGDATRPCGEFLGLRHPHTMARDEP